MIVALVLGGVETAAHRGLFLPPQEREERAHAFDHLIEADRRSREAGQGLAEYALILALICIIAIAALVFLGTQISAILSTIGQSL